ncbi:hypothetical protein DIPPA_22439 [Diplonema papillatum]|nr:hypothetical protein DIPPA_22439 [Diplonema papillatum]
MEVQCHGCSCAVVSSDKFCRHCGEAQLLSELSGRGGTPQSLCTYARRLAHYSKNLRSPASGLFADLHESTSSSAHPHAFPRSPRAPPQPETSWLHTPSIASTGGAPPNRRPRAGRDRAHPAPDTIGSYDDPDPHSWTAPGLAPPAESWGHDRQLRPPPASPGQQRDSWMQRFQPRLLDPSPGRPHVLSSLEHLDHEPEDDCGPRFQTWSYSASVHDAERGPRAHRGAECDQGTGAGRSFHPAEDACQPIPPEKAGQRRQTLAASCGSSGRPNGGAGNGGRDLRWMRDAGALPCSPENACRRRQGLHALYDNPRPNGCVGDDENRDFCSVRDPDTLPDRAHQHRQGPLGPYVDASDGRRCDSRAQAPPFSPDGKHQQRQGCTPLPRRSQLDLATDDKRAFSPMGDTYGQPFSPDGRQQRHGLSVSFDNLEGGTPASRRGSKQAGIGARRAFLPTSDTDTQPLSPELSGHQRHGLSVSFDNVKGGTPLARRRSTQDDLYPQYGSPGSTSFDKCWRPGAPPFLNDVGRQEAQQRGVVDRPARRRSSSQDALRTRSDSTAGVNQMGLRSARDQGPEGPGADIRPARLTRPPRTYQSQQSTDFESPAGTNVGRMHTPCRQPTNRQNDPRAMQSANSRTYADTSCQDQPQIGQDADTRAMQMTSLQDARGGPLLAPRRQSRPNAAEQFGQTCSPDINRRSVETAHHSRQGEGIRADFTAGQIGPDIKAHQNPVLAPRRIPKQAAQSADFVSGQADVSDNTPRYPVLAPRRQPRQGAETGAMQPTGFVASRPCPGNDNGRMEACASPVLAPRRQDTGRDTSPGAMHSFSSISSQTCYSDTDEARPSRAQGAQHGPFGTSQECMRTSTQGTNCPTLPARHNGAHQQPGNGEGQNAGEPRVKLAPTRLSSGGGEVRERQSRGPASSFVPEHQPSGDRRGARSSKDEHPSRAIVNKDPTRSNWTEPSGMIEHPSRSSMIEHPSRTDVHGHPIHSTWVEHPSRTGMNEQPRYSSWIEHPSRSSMNAHQPSRSALGEHSSLVPSAVIKQLARIVDSEHRSTGGLGPLPGVCKILDAASLSSLRSMVRPVGVADAAIASRPAPPSRPPAAGGYAQDGDACRPDAVKRRISEYRQEFAASDKQASRRM